MNHLVPCPECGRHVRVSEAACPFCALPLDLAATPEPVMPNARLSRAATLAFRATLLSATALAACSGTETGGTIVPLYGGPSGGNLNVGGAGSAGAGGTGVGVAGGGVAVYGAPAGGDSNIGSGGDGGADIGEGGAVPSYGAPSGDGGDGGTSGAAP